jgi:hypothetical protein
MTNVPDSAITGAMVGIPLWVAVAVAVVAVIGVWATALLWLEVRHRDKTVAWQTHRIAELERERQPRRRSFDEHTRLAIALTGRAPWTDIKPIPPIPRQSL